MFRRALALMLLASSSHAAMMSGAYGPYMMTREASGTSWQPDSTPHEGIHLHRGDWMMMTHGYLDLVYDRQDGPRGGEKNFVSGMGMLMGSRPLGSGTVALRAMLSADPAMGPSGYPLLLQTGETGDGVHGLRDRQHPHDFFMELAASYSVPFGADASAFAYAGLPGEPALGPPAFMHRFSGAENPEAPISHHWLDSTHIAEGVLTLGATKGGWKLEGSAFQGREPDRFRWDIEKPKLDSYSGRLSWNPTSDWSLQVSGGQLHEPESLEPGKSQERLTASASRNARFGDGVFSQTTVAFGRTRGLPGPALGAWLLETTARKGPHTVFARAERVEKNELFQEGEPLHGETFAVGKVSLGYRYDFAKWKRAQLGAGGLASVHVVPAGLRPFYGDTPVGVMLFVRAKLI